MHKPQKIFHLFAYWHDPRWKQFAGATVKILDLAHNLSAQGQKVVLFLPKYQFNHDGQSFETIEVPFINFPAIRLLSFNIVLIFYLVFNLFRGQPDVVYVRRMNSFVPAIFAKLQKAIFLYEINDDPYKSQYQEGSKAVFKLRAFISEKQDEICLSLCTKAFVINKALAKKILQKNDNLKPEKIIIMPSGANVELFKPRNKIESRIALNLDNKKKYICFIGSLLEHQGIDNLIRAAPMILKKLPQSLFLIIGEGPMKMKWYKQVTLLELDDFFIFTGQVNYEDLPIWIGAADVCVAPYNSAAGLRSPVKIFDYMSCAKPVVASNIPGTTDIFCKTDALSLVKPECPEKLAKSILHLLVDYSCANQMGVKGRSLIVSNYSRKSIAEKVLNITCGIIANRNN
jgi:glycosyltransferase involved in cell wall biosynthesis